MNVVSVDPGITRTGLYLYRSRGSASLLIERAHGQGRYEYLRDMRRALLEHARGLDLALVEDYAYSRTPNSGRDSIEAGAVVRVTLVEMGIPLVLVNPMVWKALTIGHMKKRSAAESANYRRAVREKYRRSFATTDEADAFLIYQAVFYLWQHGGETQAQRALRAQIAEILLVSQKEVS